MKKGRLVGIFAAAFALGCARLVAAPSPEEVVVVYNENDLVSSGIAYFYAQQRGVPQEQVIGIACSSGETISRDEYDKTLAEPLREIFTEKGWWKLDVDFTGAMGLAESSIRYLVLARGIPSRINPQGGYEGDAEIQPLPIGNRNEAAVDSELAALGLFTKQISGVLPNPFYRSDRRADELLPPWFLFVTRLDGPTGHTARKIIIDSLEAEKEGLRGWAYIDARNIQQEGYAEGDAWLKRAARALREAGFPVVFDNWPEQFPPGYPFENAAFYLGWYSENATPAFQNRLFQFTTGAVALHIHSFSGASVRNPAKYWVAPLLTKGAAATIGNVWEPYLALTPEVDIFTQRLLDGWTFAESAYASLKTLSWMTTVVGDPLYRPFRYLQEEPREKVKILPEFERYRKAAKERAANEKSGSRQLRELARREGNAFYLEALATLEEAEGKKGEAMKTLAAARRAARDLFQESRMLYHEARLLQQLHGKERALHFLQRALAQMPHATDETLVLRALVQLLSPPPEQQMPNPEVTGPAPTDAPVKKAIPVKPAES